MTCRVRILPSGREFEVSGTESVLDAGLRAGMNLSHSCSGGTCGKCKARVVEGQLAEIRFHDFHIPEAERAAGYVLLCRTVPATDLVIEATEFRSAADIPVQEIQTKVAKLQHLDGDIMALNLRTPRTQTLQFLAGQHITLLPGGLDPRNKSIASCPCNAMQLQIHVRRRPGDPFSSFVFDTLKTGARLDIRGPWGSFTLDEESRRPLVFIAFDVGFGPIKSLIEHAIALEMEQPMHLYWISGRRGGHYMANYCQSWVDALDEFRFTAIGGDRDVPESEIDDHFLQSLTTIIAAHPELDRYDIYMTAPSGASSEAEALLISAGAMAGHLKVDRLERF